ncbi:hypothetical protein J8L70_01465 [Pseudoalteromonas sp. MMG010]|uniref:hypothetical protein n=1 Tax=Pseudoalteromonas sp. MMG010 TaxID=2822685 RepID=UPI001B3A2EE0|nr:hypothetical protein [Pseudoalteromonas sp. MMG010]MBQ4831900.1 hypothetical protein [Pseudoalteromonas sp. MMG010]
MKNIIKLTSIAAAFTFTSFATIAETTTVTASVTVQNSFEFTAGDPLNFGIIRATNGSSITDFASIELPALAGSNPIYDATGANGDTAEVSVLDDTDLSPATFTIAGASGFTDIAIEDMSGTTVDMIAQDAPPGGPGFTLSDFTFYVVDGTNSGDSGDIDGTPAIITTDINGSATFSLGATLTTDKTVFTSYTDDVAYTGDVSVTVNYN